MNTTARRSMMNLCRFSSRTRSEHSLWERVHVRDFCDTRRSGRESAGTSGRSEGRTVRILVFAAIAMWIGVSPVSGQEASAGRRFDSSASVPLAGAVVQVSSRSSGRAPHTVVTDSLGGFVVPNLPSGPFVVGFYHNNLTTLGLDAPLAVVELGADAVVRVDLWIPSAPVVQALRCGGVVTTDARGMLVGSLRNAENGLAVREAVLRLSWRALAFDSANYRTITESATAVISSDGSLLACHLPSDATLDLEVSAPGRRTLTGAVVIVPENGIATLHLALADTARTHGTSRIRGHVRTPAGKSVTTGRAIIAALGREVPIREGEFLLNDVPTGSWVVEARVVGREPQSLLVSANDSATTMVEMRVGETPQHLDAVTVVGKRDENARLLEEVLRRKRIGMGTVFLPGSPALRSATFTSDVMKEARGFLYQGQGRITARVDGRGIRCPYIAVYVDDVLQPDGFDGLDAIARPSDVLAIETFPSLLLAPAKYRIAKTVLSTYGSRSPKMYCAVVLVWTRNRTRG